MVVHVHGDGGGGVRVSVLPVRSVVTRITLRHVGLVVSDVGRAREFWARLGFTHLVADVIEDPAWMERLGLPTDLRTVKLEAEPGHVIELYCPGPDHRSVAVETTDTGLEVERVHYKVHRPLFQHVAVTVADIEQVAPGGWHLNPEGTAKVAFLVDPDGNRVELVEDVVPFSNEPNHMDDLVEGVAEQRVELVEDVGVDYGRGQAPVGRDENVSPSHREGTDGAGDTPTYLAHTYRHHAFTDYPKHLAEWLKENVFGGELVGPTALVDLGCGRGEYINAFCDLGYRAVGVDLEPDVARQHVESRRVVGGDVERGPLSQSEFDCALSKSVIEHCHDPVAHLKVARSCLKSGGRLAVLTPAWEAQYRDAFYVDPTHVSPMTRVSLQTAMELAGFTNVRVDYFTQLPWTWGRGWWARAVVALLRALPLKYRPFWPESRLPESWNTQVRFAKETMLLGVGTA